MNPTTTQPLRASLCCLGVASLAALLSGGCGAVFENQTSEDLARYEDSIGPEQDEEPSYGPAKHFGGDLKEYVAYALEHSPSLRASYDDWRAASHRVSPARRLPNPVFSYAYFIQSVETRVGPQRHRFMLEQTFPWPTKLIAGAESASYAARGAQRRFEADGLAITRRVVAAYWKLWVIGRTRLVLRDQLEVLRYMAESARGRLEVGRGGLADVGQIELLRSRLRDMLAGLDEQEKQASSELVAALGAPPDTKTPVTEDPPPLLEPTDTVEALRQAVRAHPRIDSLDLMARSREEGADSAAADSYPNFMLGLTWIETGEAAMPGQPDSGKDPVIISLGVSLPIWSAIHGDLEDSARAEGAAFRARKASAIDEAVAELDKTLASLRDAIRRVKLYRHTLVPQAELVYASVLGSYQVGEGGIASGLLAQRELLELELGTFRAQAEHAAAWARLEELVGRAVPAREITIDVREVTP